MILSNPVNILYITCLKTQFILMIMDQSKRLYSGSHVFNKIKEMGISICLEMM